MQAAGQQYGLPGFVPDDPLEVAATSPAELPLHVRRSLLNAEPSRSVLIHIHDDAPAERLQIRWQAALRICRPLLRGRPRRVVSLSPGLEQGVAWNHGRAPAVQVDHEVIGLGLLVGADR